LELVLEHLRPRAPLRWSPPDNFHVTTKFIGAWPEDRLDALKARLAEISAGGPVSLKIEGFGWFENPHHPRSLFAGVEGGEALAELHAKTDTALGELGIETERRPFRPHLTLARIKEPVDLAPLRRAIAQLPSAQFGQSIAAKHLLYRSDVGPDGSTYSVIGEFSL
jgi:2'-5' RNA ligase